MHMLEKLDLYLAKPRGFCAGVERAIDIVETALEVYGAPVYVRHEIVHNKYVVDMLKKKGAIFVNELDEVPEKSITIFSAHGVSTSVEQEAERKRLNVIDATCPLVKKVHLEAQKNERNDYKLILIGHKGHPEVNGTSGQVSQEVCLVQNPEDVEKVPFTKDDEIAYVTQTTLSVDDTKDIIEALKNRFPNIRGPELKNICYATQNRQNAVKELAELVDLILVVGAKNSSNSNRLRDIGEEQGRLSYLINGEQDLNAEWFVNIKSVGITAGASAPEILVQNVIERIEKIRPINIRTINGIDENVKFKLPKQLLQAQSKPC